MISPSLAKAWRTPQRGEFDHGLTKGKSVLYMCIFTVIDI